MQLVTTSQIAGSFRGWKQNRVFRLINGQYWKQVDAKYVYQYATMPGSKIWHESSRNYLEISGMSDKVEVRAASSSELEESEADDE